MRFLLEPILLLIPLVLALTIHEWAHAAAAAFLGDQTAKQAGRLTLNPVAHLDPVGSLVLPFVSLLAQGSFGGAMVPILGWAKPTPVDASRLSKKISPRRGEMVVAIAGIAGNLVAAFISFAVPCLVTRQQPDLASSLLQFCLPFAYINISLAVFNLLPFAPLDGEKIVLGLLPTRNAVAYAAFSARYSFIALLAVIFVARHLLGRPVQAIAGAMLSVLMP